MQCSKDLLCTSSPFHTNDKQIRRTVRTVPFCPHRPLLVYCTVLCSTNITLPRFSRRFGKSNTKISDHAIAQMTYNVLCCGTIEYRYKNFRTRSVCRTLNGGFTLKRDGTPPCSKHTYQFSLSVVGSSCMRRGEVLACRRIIINAHSRPQTW